MTVGTPQPAVLHLLTIFRQISAGEIRIPAFQRGFVWKEKQIIELLDSVRAGYPIGSILLWQVNSPILKVAKGNLTSFPDVEEKYPTSYILDGMQRLSSLYGVFHFASSTADSKFNIHYDLNHEEFLHAEDILPDHKYTIPLAALFVPRELLKHQADISKLPNSEIMIQRLITLQSIFQDYMIPVVLIKGEDIGPIVNVFEKINSTGTLLSKVDFMRAITWAQDFDLTKYIDETETWLDELGFPLSQETIIKCIGMLLGISPTTDALLTLRNKSSRELTKAFHDIRPALEAVINFFYKHFEIRSSIYIPYEGLILVVFKAIGMGEIQTKEELLGLKRWFWSTSFNESLRGKPDHYVVRAVEDWQSLIKGNVRGLEPRLKISEADFLERRLIKGRAFSVAFTILFANFKACDLWTSEVIDFDTYMRSGDASVFKPILNSEELETLDINTGGGSAKTFANLILDPNRFMANVPLKDYFTSISNKSPEVLYSQFLDEAACNLFLKNDYIGFLERRASLMNKAASSLVESKN